MSEKKDILVLSSPNFGTGKETIGYYTGYACGYCHGNGWFWNPEIIKVAFQWNGVRTGR